MTVMWIRRLGFAAAVLFWLAMNFLLWRSEYRGANELGNSLPVSVVWEKVLAAPDHSALDIFRGDEKIGYCRWLPNVAEEPSAREAPPDEGVPEGMVERLTGYTTDLEGSVLWGEDERRVRFSIHGDFDAAGQWERFRARITLRPVVLELEVSAAERAVRVSVDQGDGAPIEREFAFDDLRNPAALLAQAGLSGWAPPDLSGSGTGAWPSSSLNSALAWSARLDWMSIGRSRVRVYRVEARWLDETRAAVELSRVGEVLTVELPGDVRLANEALLR